MEQEVEKTKMDIKYEDTSDDVYFDGQHDGRPSSINTTTNPNNCSFQVSDTTGADNMDKVIVKSEDGDVFEVSLLDDHRTVNDETINWKVESVEFVDSFSEALKYDNKPEDCRIERIQPHGSGYCLGNLNHVKEETHKMEKMPIEVNDIVKMESCHNETAQSGCYAGGINFNDKTIQLQSETPQPCDSRYMYTTRLIHSGAKRKVKTEPNQERVSGLSPVGIPVDYSIIAESWKSPMVKQENSTVTLEYLNHNDMMDVCDSGANGLESSGSCNKDLTNKRQYKAKNANSTPKYIYQEKSHCGQRFKLFETNFGMWSHQPVHVRPKQTVCPVDVWRGRSKTHIEEGYNCLECGKVFKRENSLHVHRAVHISERTVSCTFEGCNKMFKIKEHMQNHRLLVHRKQQFKCSLCGKMFKREDALCAHKAVHVHERTVSCAVAGCNKMFKTKDHVKQHMLLVHGNQRFKCPLCDNAFKSKMYVDRHQAVHIAKPFVCPEANCNHRRFAKEHQLEIHKRTSHVQKKHQCPNCDKRFSKPRWLEKHRNTHLPDQIECPVGGCKKTFKTQKSVAGHNHKDDQN